MAGTALTPLSALAGGYAYALAPELAPLCSLFDSQKLAVMLNVGPLVQPTTKAQYTARSVPLPPKLFSHNDHSNRCGSLRPLHLAWLVGVAVWATCWSRATATPVSPA